MPELPQELIDRIIDNVHDRASLKACSLVCSQWSPRSRKHLFVQVEFASQRDLERWRACIHPGPLGLSSLVRCLFLSEGSGSSPYSSSSLNWLRSSVLSDAASHFQSFSALQALGILEWRLSTGRVSSMFRSFGSSLENVTILILGGVIVHPSILMTFISHFPRLYDLTISAILYGTLDDSVDLHHEFRADVIPTHPRGRFSVSHMSTYQMLKWVFDAVILLEPRFHRVALAHVRYDRWRDYWPLVEGCAELLEGLIIFADATTDANCDGLSLACCPNLRRIVLSLGHQEPARPCKFIEKCLSTITSTQLSEVSLRLLRGVTYLRPCNSNLALWDPLDIVLYDLAGKYQPRYEGDKMLVKLVDVYPDLSGSKDFLWRYRERGTLQVNSET